MTLHPFRAVAIATGIICLTSNLLWAQFFTQVGTDPTWKHIIDNKLIPIGSNSTAGITGSQLTVNRELLEKGLYGNLPIDPNIKIHTVGTSKVDRNDFKKWSRWYQEDGNTQIFRLFKGEYNVRNNRAGAPRIEAFSDHKYSQGGWQEWVGRYTIIKAQDLNIFQIFGDGPGGNTGQMMLGLRSNGDVYFNPRRPKGHSDEVLVKNAEGKSFDIRIRHNGNEYEIYLNGELKIKHHVRSNNNHFRWGMYGHDNMPGEAMLMITGATVNPGNKPRNASIPAFENSARHSLNVRSLPGGIAELAFGLTSQKLVSAAIYNNNGALMARIPLGVKSAGAHKAYFSTSALTPGIHLLRFEYGGESATRFLSINQ